MAKELRVARQILLSHESRIPLDKYMSIVIIDYSHSLVWPIPGRPVPTTFPGGKGAPRRCTNGGNY